MTDDQIQLIKQDLADIEALEAASVLDDSAVDRQAYVMLPGAENDLIFAKAKAALGRLPGRVRALLAGLNFGTVQVIRDHPPTLWCARDFGTKYTYIGACNGKDVVYAVEDPGTGEVHPVFQPGALERTVACVNACEKFSAEDMEDLANGDAKLAIVRMVEPVFSGQGIPKLEEGEGDD